jgi:hypothetical protein
LSFSEDGLDRLLTRGELGGDVHHLARPGGSLATQFAHQVAASGAGEERADDIRVGDVGQLGALLRKSPDVVPQGISRLLAAASEITGVPRAHVCALEVVGEVKGKCAFGPFLSILVIECKHKCLNVPMVEQSANHK